MYMYIIYDLYILMCMYLIYLGKKPAVPSNKPTGKRGSSSSSSNKGVCWWYVLVRLYITGCTT